MEQQESESEPKSKQKELDTQMFCKSVDQDADGH